MKSHQILWSAFLIVKFLSCTSNKNIAFLPLDQNEFKTMCENGTLTNDMITFKSHIALNRIDLFDNMTYVNYAVNEFEGENNPTDAFAKLVNIECEKTRDKIECRKSDDSMIFLYQVLAKEKYFKANMTVYLSKHLNRSETDIQAFPQIYDPRNASGNLTINGVDIPIDNCKTNIRSYNLNLTFVCSSPAKPCKIEITTNDSTTATFNETAVFERSLQNQTALEMVINYAACRLDGHVNSIRCIVTVDLTSTTENDDLEIVIIISVIVSIAITAVIVLLVLIAKGKISVKCTPAWNRRFANCSCCEAQLGQAHENIHLKEKGNEPNGNLEENRTSEILKKENVLDKSNVLKIMSTGDPSTSNQKEMEKAAMLNNVKNITRPYVNDDRKKGKELRKKNSLLRDLLDSSKENKRNENIAEGTHEIQQDKSESFLHKFYTSCKKNPSHEKFMRLQDLTVDQVPEQDANIVAFIKSTAELTVRLSVNFNSTARQTEWHNRHEPVPFDVLTLPRIGTGFVTHVQMYEKKRGHYNIESCPCEKCKNSNLRSYKWGEISLTTSKYLVFDDIEAKETICRFRYDDKRSKLYSLRGWEVESKNDVEERCILQIKTCDTIILNFFRNALTDWSEAKNDINRKYASYQIDRRFTFIVSHPHGCPKYVSLGECINKTELTSDKMHTSYTYTTSTCAGCTGAYVHFLGVNVDITRGSHIHCGINDLGNNYCNIGHECT